MDEHELNGLLPLEAVAPPLRIVEGGAVRVGKSRITLDLVVEEYESGMTPEDMVRAYDTLVLADVYAAIAYYLSHREAVREYMKGAKARPLRCAPRLKPGNPASRETSSSPAAPHRKRPMLRLATDADVQQAIIRGVRRHAHGIDLVHSSDVLSEGTPAPDVLAWAAAENRVLITNDRATMIGFANRRLTAGEPLPAEAGHRQCHRGHLGHR